MFDVRVSEEQKCFSRDLIQRCNFGNRGVADGTPIKQYFGILGQTVVCDLFGFVRPDGEKGFDGGYDFVINNKKVDVKTMSRTTVMRDYYVHNFIAFQKFYDVDYYLFLSFNRTNDILTVCGYNPKDEFFEKSKFYKKGDIRTRSDGSSFVCEFDSYEIEQSCLRPCLNINDLVNGII